MISIKNSFADCSTCELLDSTSCIFETNSKADLSKVEIIFVSEDPGKEECKKGTPLVGKYGKVFREHFNEYIKKDFKYLITNCVLCTTVNNRGQIERSTDAVINRCKVNAFNIIKQCNPRLIVLLGQATLKAFGFGDSNIISHRGKFSKWEGIDVLMTIHPSFLTKNKSFESKFKEDIMASAEFMGTKFEKTIIAGPSDIKGKGIHRYTIPGKFYTDEYRLVDIQFLHRSNRVLYMFRDKNNKRIDHFESDEYICYQIPNGIDARQTLPYSELDQISIPYKERSKLDNDITYEGDVKICAKHAMDYYHFNKGDAPVIDANIFYFDIEIDTGEFNRTFPHANLAEYPINMISGIYQGKTIVYVIDHRREKILSIEGVVIKEFKNEKSMLSKFIDDFREMSPDYMTGWNSIAFDLEYLSNRLPKLGLNLANLTKYKEAFVDASRFNAQISGLIPLDQMNLYKMFTFTKKENYQLTTITNDEIGIGKIVMPHPINEMYYKDINALIKYNIRDTELLVKLEAQVKHINLLNEIRLICNGSFRSTSGVLGQIDCIILSYLKKQGVASKNGNPHIVKESYPGAFVYSPIPGIYNNVADFDFASLYPSIIQTYNIGMNTFAMKLKDPKLGYELTYCPEKLPDVIDIIIDPMFEKKECTIKREALLKKIKDSKLIHTINGCLYKSHEEEMSIYSIVLKNLLSSRKEYKGQMFEAEQSGDKALKDLYNTRQLVYKVLANSLYGAVANKIFRFFDVSCAGAITLGGQEALKWSIIEGNAFMKSLDKGEDYVPAEPLNKLEMYSYTDDFESALDKRDTPYIVTGDTDSIFCNFGDFKGDKSDEVIKDYCNKIQTFLNDIVIPDKVLKHNVDVSYNKLVLKNELIISRGLFLAKKRYAIRVVNNEGHKVDKINFMGLEVKRSDYPSLSKKFLVSLVELILKSEKVSLPKLFKFVALKEKEFIKAIRAGDKSIARPVSFGKKLKDYKVLPQGVRSMLAWNVIVRESHVVGARGHMFRVSGIDETKAPPEIMKNYMKFITSGNKKLEVICIPDDEPSLPDYFIPNLKGNLKFAFEDRYELLLKPLNEVKKEKDLLLC